MKKLLPIVILFGWIGLSYITFGQELFDYANNRIYVIGKYAYFSEYIISFVVLSILLFFYTSWLVRSKTVVLNTVLGCLLFTMVFGFSFRKYDNPYYEHTITINNQTDRNADIEVIPGIKGEVIIKTRISANSKFSFPIYTTFKGAEGKKILSVNQIIEKNKVATLLSNNVENLLLDTSNETNLYVK